MRSLSQTSTNEHNQTLKSNSDSSESRSPSQHQQHHHHIQQQQQQQSQFLSTSQPNNYMPSSTIQYSHQSTDETDKSSENFESSIEGDYYEENDDNNKRRQKKRGIFPKAATSLMRAWLFQHLNVRFSYSINTYKIIFYLNSCFSIRIHLKNKKRF